MLRKILHIIIVKFPFTYTILRYSLGFRKLRRWLAQFLVDLEDKSIIDLGAGNGDITVPILPSLQKYCWLDIDPLKLAQFQKKFAASLTNPRLIIGDATRIAFANKSFDCSLFFSIAHHLSDEQFANALSESARVTKNKMIFFEPLLNDSSRVSHWLWKNDRGTHLRSKQVLREMVCQNFKILDEHELTIYNGYIVYIAVPFE